MFRQPLARFGLCPLLLLMAVSVARADWLDVTVESMQITNLRTGQTGNNVSAVAGDSISLVCGYRVGLYGDHELWVADREQRWENRAVVDGVTLAVFRPSIPAGTQMGVKRSSSAFGLSTKAVSRPSSIADVHPEVRWTAAGVGPHELQCVVNQPKTISDHVATNNVATGIVTVEARQAGAPRGTLKRPADRSGSAAPPAIDLAIEDALEVGGVATGWGRTLTLTSEKTTPASDGYCMTYVDFAIRNQGEAKSLPFEVLLTNDASPGRYSKAQAAMARDERSVQTARMILKPGRNRLNLQLDPAGAVGESNRENNRRSLRVDLEGDCHVATDKPVRGGR